MDVGVGLGVEDSGSAVEGGVAHGIVPQNGVVVPPAVSRGAPVAAAVSAPAPAAHTPTKRTIP